MYAFCSMLDAFLMTELSCDQFQLLNVKTFHFQTFLVFRILWTMYFPVSSYCRSNCFRVYFMPYRWRIYATVAKIAHIFRQSCDLE